MTAVDLGHLDTEPLPRDPPLELQREQPVVAPGENPDRDVGPALELARLTERGAGGFAVLLGAGGR